MPYYDGRPVEDVDYYYGHRSTDITKRHGIQIPSHAGHPSLKDAPQPYYVLPYHDLTDKFRKRPRDRTRMFPVNSYYGRRVSEITDPARIPGNWKGAFLGPYPPSSERIGDSNFTRYEYMHPLGKKKPGPMDDYVPMRDRYGRFVRPASPEDPGRARRRLLGLPADKCHRQCPTIATSSETRLEEWEDGQHRKPQGHHYGREEGEIPFGKPLSHKEGPPKNSSGGYPVDEFRYQKPPTTRNDGESGMPPDFIDCQRSRFGGPRRNVCVDEYGAQEMHPNKQQIDPSRHQRLDEYGQPQHQGDYIRKNRQHRQPVGGRAGRFDSEDFKPDRGHCRQWEDCDSWRESPSNTPPMAELTFQRADDNGYGQVHQKHRDESNYRYYPSHFHSKLQRARDTQEDSRDRRPYTAAVDSGDYYQSSPWRCGTSRDRAGRPCEAGDRNCYEQCSSFPYPSRGPTTRHEECYSAKGHLPGRAGDQCSYHSPKPCPALAGLSCRGDRSRSRPPSP